MTEPAISSTAREVIYARHDVPLRVRDAALWLYGHELKKMRRPNENAALQVMERILQWVNHQKRMEMKRRLEPTETERRILHMLIVDGMTMKQIALKTGQQLGAVKLRFGRMRSRLGNLTLYQLVALSVERGWITIKNDEL